MGIQIRVILGKGAVWSPLTGRIGTLFMGAQAFLFRVSKEHFSEPHSHHKATIAFLLSRPFGCMRQCGVAVL
jgi:hypothetical protein